jgi:hypothetical protein
MVIFCNSDAYIFFPAMGWGSAVEAERMRETLETRNMPAGGAMTVAIGIQAVNNPNDSDAAVALATSRTSDGLSFPGALVDRTGTTGSKQLYRAGYLAKNTTTSDTTVRFCWAAGMVETQKK